MILGIILSLHSSWVWSRNKLWPMRNVRGSQCGQLPERDATLPHLLPLTNVQTGRQELSVHLGPGDLGNGAHTWWNIRKDRAWVLEDGVDQSHHTRTWLPDFYKREKLNATLSAPLLFGVCYSQPCLLLCRDEDLGLKVSEAEKSFEVDWQKETGSD